MTRRTVAERAELKARVWELRVQCVPFQSISEKLGVPIGTVYAWHKEMLESREPEAAESYVETELARLEFVQQQLMEQLLEQRTAGRSIVGTADAMTRNSERRAKMMGLDRPTRVDATVHEVTQADLEILQWESEAKAKAAIEEQRILEAGQ